MRFVIFEWSLSRTSMHNCLLASNRRQILEGVYFIIWYSNCFFFLCFFSSLLWPGQVTGRWSIGQAKNQVWEEWANQNSGNYDMNYKTVDKLQSKLITLYKSIRSFFVKCFINVLHSLSILYISFFSFQICEY